MAKDYAKTAKMVNRLLTKFGGTGTLRVVTDGAYDPSTGSSSSSQTDKAVNAVVLNVEQSDLANTAVKFTDSKVYMSTLTAIPLPTTSDLFIWNSDTYSIVSVTDISPAGVSVMFELVVRK